ncbi:hypothetical protein [uncultured Friedmanniella sp.]|uniref:hypothetical protein n=1 Tax=uncultured Friedmanniella sp. TaxID=335381 RepID=UPI0035CC5669
MTSMAVILQELAAGRIDAAEAARRIDGLAAGPPVPEPASNEPAPNDPAPESVAEPAADEPWALATDRPQHATHSTERFAPVDPPADEVPEPEPVTPPPPKAKPANTGGVERISVRAVGRRVRILGETGVATLSADGPHVLRRNGAVLEVSSDGEIGPSLDGFSILRGAPRSMEDLRAIGFGKELLLRVNPSIFVDVEVTAGSLSTERVPNLGKIRVTAGSAKLLDVNQVNDVLVQAGSATIKGAVNRGRNRVRAESGSLAITLADDSNVTVTSESQLGRVTWSGGHTGAGDEVVMGNGSAKLDVQVVMGHAQVRIGSDPAPEAKAPKAGAGKKKGSDT